MSGSMSKQQEIDVLLLDDEEGFLEQEKIFLQRNNEKINPETVTSPGKALKSLKDDEYDCIVSDYQMPNINGLELLRKVKKERNLDIPFIMFTGKGREEVAIEALNLGTDRYLQKGGDPKSQFEVLSKAIDQETKHRRTENEKKKLESELTSLVKGSNDPIYILNRDLRINFANQAELEYHDASREELIGSKFHEFHPKQDTQTLKKKVKKVFETEEKQNQQVKHEHTGKYFDRTLSPIQNPKTGEVDRVAIISKDVTKSRKSEEKYRSLFENSPVVIWEEDYSELKNYLDKLKDESDDLEKYLDENPDQISKCLEKIKVLDVNESALDYYNADSKEELINNREKLFTDKAVEVFKKQLNAIAKGKTFFKIESLAKTLDGEKKHEIMIINIPERYSESLERAYLSIMNINERKKIEKELKKANKKYKSLFENSPVVIWEENYTELKNHLDKLKQKVDNLERYLDKNPEEIQNCIEKIKVLDVNDYALSFYGAETKEELIKSLDQLFTEDSLKKLKQELMAVANNKKYFRIEKTSKTLQDEIKNVIVDIRIPNADQNDYSKVYVSTIDITKRKKIEKELKETKTKLQERP